MSLLSEIKKICREHEIRPCRRRGQNFLISPRIIGQILKAADLKKSDSVLEIGAGLGTLTREIAGRVKKIIAVEIDKRLVEALKEQLRDYKNVEIIQEDIRNLHPFAGPGPDRRRKSYKIVANLPFNISGAVLRKFLSEKPKPELMVLMLQKEVAQRIISKPTKMNILAVSVQFYGTPQIIARVSKKNSWPRPKVDSAILRIDLRGSTSQEEGGIWGGRVSEEKFFKVVRAGFSSPRKYLLNNLIRYAIINKKKGERVLEKLGLGPKVRAQELSVENWIKIAEIINNQK